MADMSGEQMQAKITAARREAEGLKDKIKRRKDELADTSRATSITIARRLPLSGTCRASTLFPDFPFIMLTCVLQSVKSPRTRPKPYHELE